jgi:hypothetical protein
MGMGNNQAGNQTPGLGMSTTFSDEEKKRKEQESLEKPQIPQLKSPSSQANVAQAAAPKAAPKQQAAGTGTFSNLKSYIQAAQGGGQQKIAQAATQKVQNVASGAQKEISQSQKTFGKQVDAGTLADREAAGTDVEAAIKSARNVTYQAPQVPQATQEVQPAQEPSTVPQTPVAAPPVEVTPEQAQRFQDIINARYEGPGSIQEAGLYNRAAEKARTAQEAVKQTQTAAGREQLLRNIFSQGRDYSRGQSKLDSLLLNTSQQGLGQLQQQAQQAGDLQQKLQQAQTESANTATGRANEISNIQQQARKSFLEGRTEEETATEKGIDALIKDPALDASGKKIPKLDSTGKPMVDAKGDPVYQTKWDQLPEYYREAIRNKEATNKDIQKERLAALTAYEPQVQQLTEANKQVAETEAAIRSAEYQIKQLKRYGNKTQAAGQIQVQLGRLQQLRQQSDAQKAQAAAIQQSPEYQQYTQQKTAAAQMNMNQLSLSPEEAAVLGISSGEGLYNVGQNLIQDVNAERERLVTKDQFARQQALARLAGLDTSKALQKDLQYTDSEKAGTQTLKSSLNTKAVRDALNEQEAKFREEATAKTITGTGSKKNKTSGKRYYASEDANVKDVLSRAGYDFNAPVNQQVGNLDIYGSRSQDQDPDTLGSIAEEAVTPRLTPDQITDVYTNDSTLARKAGYAAADYGSLGITAGLRSLGLDLTGGVMSGIDNIAGTSIFGGGTSSKESKSDAARFAREDLQRRYAEYLKDTGFSNRAGIEDTQTTSARTAALQDLLRRQG